MQRCVLRLPLFLFFLPYAVIQPVNAGIIWTVFDGNLLTPVKSSSGVLYSPLCEKCRLPK